MKIFDFKLGYIVEQDESSYEYMLRANNILFSRSQILMEWERICRTKHKYYFDFPYFYLYTNSKKYLQVNNEDVLTEAEKIRMDVSVNKNNPEYWIKEYNSFITIAKKLGRNPDGPYSNGFKIPEHYRKSLNYDDRIKNLQDVDFDSHKK
ncbi:MAG: hypothetical protein LC122_13850 [Chitinophagales bacterium]|nr:hypothetical protein [Chitinophagales bacterium]